MWRPEKIELIKNSVIATKNDYCFEDCYTLKINDCIICNSVNPKLTLEGCWQNNTCTFCGAEGCHTGGMLRLVKQGNSLMFIPDFECMESYEEWDFWRVKGESECPPHEWYERGILVVEGDAMQQLLSVLRGLSLEKIPDASQKQLDSILEWENLVKEKPLGFMALPELRYLFLDDIRNPIDASSFAQSRGVNPDIYKEGWIILRNYLEFTNWITNFGLPDLISFDHDLGEADEHTGMDCAKWLVNYCLDNNCALPQWAVHSANPAGYDNIKGLLMSFEKNAKQ